MDDEPIFTTAERDAILAIRQGIDSDRPDDPAPYLRTFRDHVEHYMQFCAPRWLGGPYMRWHEWTRTSAQRPGVRRYVRVGRFDVDLLYGAWEWRPRILTARRATMSPGVVGVVVLPGKHGLGLSRRTAQRSG